MKTIKKKKAVVQPTSSMIENNRRLEELNKLRITTKTVLPPENSSISLDGIPFFEIGDVGAIKAKQKAGKTTLLKTLTAAWMKGELFRLKSELKEARVLWLDTEQKQSDVRKIIDDVKQLSGVDDNYIDKHLKLYSVRTLSYKTLLEDTKILVSSYRPNVILLDGLVDFCQSFNDETLSHQLINELIALSDNYKCAIICVLHENKSETDNNMRGHLGTMLAQKAGTVLQCKKESNVIVVCCCDSRHAAIPKWKIMYDEYGHIISADEQQMTPAQEEKNKREQLIKKIIQDNGGSIARKELTEKLTETLQLSRTRVSNLISEFLQSSICEVNGMIQIQPELDWLIE